MKPFAIMFFSKEDFTLFILKYFLQFINFIQNRFFFNFFYLWKQWIYILEKRGLFYMSINSLIHVINKFKVFLKFFSIQIFNVFLQLLQKLIKNSFYLIQKLWKFLSLYFLVLISIFVYLRYSLIQINEFQ